MRIALLLLAGCVPSSGLDPLAPSDVAPGGLTADPGAAAGLADVQAAFDDRGLSLTRGAERITLSAGDPVAPTVAAPAAVGLARPGLAPLAAEVTVWERGAAREWWATVEEGFEHGFVVDAAPADPTVRFTVRVEGATVAPLRDGAALRAPDGWTLEYGGLAAWDASGRELPGALTVEGQAIVLAVDTTGARFPVVVDPLLTTGTTTLASLTGGDFSGAGDVNGDGYDDVVAIDDATHVLYWFLGSASGASSASGSISAYALGPYTVMDAAGDVNGDGYDDVVVANSSTAFQRGRVYVFRGSATGLSSTPSITITGATVGGRLGTEVAGLGDTNGDGYDDFVAATGAGVLHVYLGGPGIPPRPRRITVADWGTTGETLAGGDLNGDGYADLVVGRYRYDNNVSGGYSPGYTGAVDVHYGSASGVAAAADTIVWPYGYWYDSYASSCWDMQKFGWSVAVAGDTNGDGYDELVVGLPSDCEYGATAVYDGGAAGVDDSQWAYFFGRTAYGAYPDGALSGSTLAVGDFDGDGAGDYATGGGPVTYVESNGAGFTMSYGDSYGGSITPLYATELSGTSYYLDTTRWTYATAAVDTVGDVNGDGCDDLAVYNPTSLTAGTMTMYYGYNCTGVVEADTGVVDATE